MSMAKYLFVYHGGGAPSSPEEGKKVMAAWMAWMEGIGSGLVDGGAPVGKSSTVRSDGSVANDGGANPVSGYSLIEAMSCGVMPCVTYIQSFRAITGGIGVLWAVGDADACAAALADLAARDRDSERERVRQRYADALSWESIGKRTVTAYRDLAARRRSAGR